LKEGLNMPDSKHTDTHVPLKGSRRYRRSGSQDLGPADDHERCELTVKVRRKANLPELLPGKIISRTELENRCGADPKDFDTVEKVLTNFGLTILSKHAASRSMRVAGPVDVMERAFAVQLFQMKHGEHSYRGRVDEIHIPRELDGIVTRVFGLDTRPMIKHRRPFQLQLPQALPPALRLKAHEALPPPNQRSWYLPQELAKAYNFPTCDGAGQTIAILEFGGRYLLHDLRRFMQLAGLPSSVPEVKVTNVQALSPQEENDPVAIGETMLDIEIVAGVCPKATISVYFSRWTEQGWIDNLDAALHESTVPTVLSISYGLAEGEEIWTQQAIDEVNDTLHELALAGITVCVASGDDGSDAQVDDGLAHVNFPASSPYVLAVGGTTLMRSTGKERVWFEGNGIYRDGGGSSGGGVSEMNPRPSWQNVEITSVNPRAFRGRIVPDVAANAANCTGYFVVAQDTPRVAGGTSAATPLWAALIARLCQSGKQVGFLPPALYRSNANTNRKPLGEVACKDIKKGSNAAGNAAGYTAKAGYDAVTGWGSPDGTEMLNKL
jgi:kumamolisin